MAILVDIVFRVMRCVVFIYDIVTFPMYSITQQSWKDRTKQNLGPSKCVTKTRSSVSYRRDKGDSPIYQEIIIQGKVDTVTKSFNYAVKKYGEKSCLGTREILGEEDEMQKNGKLFKKLALGDYKWLSYNQVADRALAFGRGLRALGQMPRSAIAMYGETRAEWMMSCLGAFSQNIHVCTVYTNLGDDAVVHALNETRVQVVVTSHELLPKFRSILDQLPHITHVIYMEDQLQPTQDKGFGNIVKIIPFTNVVNMGTERSDIHPCHPTPDDTAIVMYTSGSTGTPKGVVLTHKNLVATMKCLMFMIEPKEDDIYIAYLPLAHVLELMSENTMMLFGIKVGYSSPNTMTDMSTKVLKGYKGDASVLKPTMMCAVPLIMDRIYKNITDSVLKKGVVAQKMFQICYNYKLFWTKLGYRTPVCDKIIFNKIRALLGGKVELILVGGAPLSPQTHEFIRVCLGTILIQGYSLTETCCTGTVMEFSDLSTGNVGRPMTGLEIRLVDWQEGNYRVTDSPNPRGEIIVGGDPVAKGYLNPDDLNVESFFEEGGKKWFRTGDIGEFDQHGSLRIVDRKKDLVKLQLGEYVSLGKVEARLKTHPLVENICVYGDPYKKFTVALVVPSRVHLETMCHNMGKLISFEEMVRDPEVERAVLRDLTVHGLKGGLEKFEVPQAVTLIPEVWTPESGLITAAFKIKRKVIQDFYQKAIDRMYA